MAFSGLLLESTEEKLKAPVHGPRFEPDTFETILSTRPLMVSSDIVLGNKKDHISLFTTSTAFNITEMD
jgi:hypothetical protein